MGNKRICCSRNNNSNQHNKIKKINTKPITKTKRLFVNQIVITSKVNNSASYNNWYIDNSKNYLVKLNRDYKNIQIKTFKN